MLKGFYDSLETLEEVEYATPKNYRNLGIGVAVSIIIFGAFFIGVDTVWSGLYNGFHNLMGGANSTQLEQLLTTDDSGASLLDGVDNSLLGVSGDDDLTQDDASIILNTDNTVVEPENEE